MRGCTTLWRRTAGSSTGHGAGNSAADDVAADDSVSQQRGGPGISSSQRILNLDTVTALNNEVQKLRAELAQATQQLALANLNLERKDAEAARPQAAAAVITATAQIKIPVDACINQSV